MKENLKEIFLKNNLVPITVAFISGIVSISIALVQVKSPQKNSDQLIALIDAKDKAIVVKIDDLVTLIKEDKQNQKEINALLFKMIRQKEQSEVSKEQDLIKKESFITKRMLSIK